MAIYIDDLIDEDDGDEEKDLEYYVDLKALVDKLEDVEEEMEDEEDEEGDIGF